MTADSEQNTRQVIESLRNFRKRIEELTTLIDSRQTLTKESKERARELFTSFKSDLKREAKRFDTVRAEAAATPVEKAFYIPAVQQAWANLTAATNSDPIKSNWASNLFSVDVDINYLLSQLEEKFPEY